ncbi:hypothetical protein NEOLEDRAFT_1128652 [Neolentinus lepideus HHB14362 ss-1]|uniref:Zn(2)-C6 fungal-type domain-containing protein n=1 Tax=Neolentinus lepideus HHB14362 ss-1 TaxID=1314782 RepID=A0A165V3F3_9AGAM|nr:hypothetical protein NEOLEDRAFT_1128652 [Neolentinus lepideus HHB14362 ss-1]
MTDKGTVAGSSASPPTTLQRGKACLRCRKRKMRCDGMRPACHQCVRAKKGDVCEYDDGKGKTRTQLLRENIARLEQRIRELEDPEYTSPSVTLYDPHSQYSGSSSSSSAGSPPTIGIPSPSPYHLDIAGSPQGSWISRYSSPTLTGEPSYAVEERAPPIELLPLLLEIFLPHRHQLGFGLNVDRLRRSLTLPPSEQHHPVLMNSILLWSCFFSRPGPLSQHEMYYLSRSLESMNDALQDSTKVLDVIQASCLLAVYFFANGRFIEGTYHASAAASLSMQWGLQRLSLTEANAGGWEPIVLFQLDPARDAVEEGERILTFWQAYDLDRCWSVALQRPIAIHDEKDSCNSISVPWPQTMEEYVSCQLDDRQSIQTIRTFLEGQGLNTVGGFSTRALRVKAATLLQSASQLSSDWNFRLSNSNALRDEFLALEHTISRFLTTLIPVQQLDGTIPDEKHALIVIHTLAHAATIHLHYRFGQDDLISHDKCLRAASAVVIVIKHISEADFEFLDPIIGPCWMVAANALSSEKTRLETSWPPQSSVDVCNDISLIQYAMSSLGTRFPLLGEYGYY